MNTFNILAIKKESVRSPRYLRAKPILSSRLSSKRNYVMRVCPTDASHHIDIGINQTCAELSHVIRLYTEDNRCQTGVSVSSQILALCRDGD